MKRFNIILFGTMGSGKDSVADYLVSEYQYSKYKLGKYIRQHVDLLWYNNDLNKRNAMQQYGQTCRKIFGADVWNYRTLNDILVNQQIEDISKIYHPVVIADGRQFNEYEFWKNRDFIAVGVYADDNIRKQRLFERDGYVQDQYFNHETEKQAKWIIDHDCDFVINNNIDGFEHLYEQIKTVLQAIDKWGENIVAKR